MHTLILGITESGKTYLGKQIAAQLSRKHRNAVLDPLGTTWPASFETTNSDKFLQFSRKNQNCMLFVDECGQVLTSTDDNQLRNFHWLTTRARHFGHSVFLLSQRATQIPPTMRDQCQRLYLFTVSVDDALTLSEEFNKPILRTANTLRRGQFFMVDRYDVCSKFSIDFPTGKISPCHIESHSPNNDNRRDSMAHRKTRNNRQTNNKT